MAKLENMKNGQITENFFKNVKSCNIKARKS